MIGYRAFTSAPAAGIGRHCFCPAQSAKRGRSACSRSAAPTMEYQSESHRQDRGHRYRRAVHRGQIGNSEVADVHPLTDRALDTQNRTTRRGTGRETGQETGRNLDIEVSYDITRLAVELRRMTGSGHSRCSPWTHPSSPLGSARLPAKQNRRRVGSRARFAPDIRERRAGAGAPAGDHGKDTAAVEATRQAGRALGIQWTLGNRTASATVRGDQVPARSLPIPRDVINAGRPRNLDATVRLPVPR